MAGTRLKELSKRVKFLKDKNIDIGMKWSTSKRYENRVNELYDRSVRAVVGVPRRTTSSENFNKRASRVYEEARENNIDPGKWSARSKAHVAKLEEMISDKKEKEEERRREEESRRREEVRRREEARERERRRKVAARRELKLVGKAAKKVADGSKSAHFTIRYNDLDTFLQEVINYKLKYSGLWFTMRKGDHWVSLKNVSTIEQLRKGFHVVEEAKHGGSDPICSLKSLDTESGDFEFWVDRPRRKVRGERRNKEPGWFAYKHLTDLDLKHLAVYTEEELRDDSIPKYKQGCLIETLKYYGIEDPRVGVMVGRFVPKCMLGEVAKVLDVVIRLRYVTDDNRIEQSMYPRNSKVNCGKRIIDIGCCCDHYFPNVEVDVTETALKNYEKVKDLREWNRVYRLDKNGRVKDRVTKGKVQAVKVIQLMKTHNLLAPLEVADGVLKYLSFEEGEKQVTSDKLYCGDDDCVFVNPEEQRRKELCDKLGAYDNKGNMDLENEEVNAALSRWKSLKASKQARKVMVFYDVETTTDGDHLPYCCAANICYVGYEDFEEELEGGLVSFRGRNCVREMLEWVSGIVFDLKSKESAEHRRYVDDGGDGDLFPWGKVKFMAHNNKYDQSFLYEYVRVMSMIKDKTSTMEFQSSITDRKGEPFKLVFQTRDSAMYMMCTLNKFASAVGLSQSKEVMSYGAFTRDAVFDANEADGVARRMPVRRMLDNIKSDYEDIGVLRDIMLENIEKWGLADEAYKSTGMVDAIEYSRRYCEIDVEILSAAVMKLRDMLFEVSYVDLLNHLSIAGYANAVMISRGVFDGVYKITGLPKFFISQAYVGGRTMTLWNEIFNVFKKTCPMDANSLYPKGQVDLLGYLYGKPKVLLEEQLNMEFLSTVDGYFVEIDITKVGKKRGFPLWSVKEPETGVRNWTNDIIGKHVVDRFTLEDLVEYQGIEFSVLRGYYFDEGRNEKLSQVVNDLYERRQAIKKHPDKEMARLEITYKLILNSGYGYTGMKSITHKHKVYYDTPADPEVVAKAMNRNASSWVERVSIPGGGVMLKLSNPDHKQYNSVHCASEITSRARRVMNRVMCLAEDISVNIYYQDTDSMHMDLDGVDRLGEAFEDKYGEELYGKKLGQFSNDFGAEDKYSDRGIFLGKKMYMERIRTEGSSEVEHHKRMKGIPQELLNSGDAVALYESLYNGQKKEYNLLDAKLGFKKRKDMTYTTIEEFKRVVRAPGVRRNIVTEDGFICPQPVAC